MWAVQLLVVGGLVTAAAIRDGAGLVAVTRGIALGLAGGTILSAVAMRDQGRALTTAKPMALLQVFPWATKRARREPMRSFLPRYVPLKSLLCLLVVPIVFTIEFGSFASGSPDPIAVAATGVATACGVVLILSVGSLRAAERRTGWQLIVVRQPGQGSWQNRELARTYWAGRFGEDIETMCYSPPGPPPTTPGAVADLPISVRADMLVRTARYQDALHLLEAEDDPATARIPYLTAVCLAALGRDDEAIIHLRTAAEQGLVERARLRDPAFMRLRRRAEVRTIDRQLQANLLAARRR
jgi:hypothetical protein